MINKEVNAEIKITKGVLQGEILSPYLFNFFLSDIEDEYRIYGNRRIRIMNSCDILLL